MPPELRLAYVTTHYPALSHTFILREVGALRRLGAKVHTISLRRTSGEHLLSRENCEASQSTYAVRPPRPTDVIGAHIGALLRHPRAYLATLRESLAIARPGARGLLWQLFYFAEGILVWRHCARRGVDHIHAHHGSAPADVALLAAHFGAAAERGPGTWSLTLHGPNELRDVRWFGLAEKVRRAEMVVCISDFARSQLMALVNHADWEKLRVVHCGVRPSEFDGPSQPRREPPQVLCVGRLVPEKGHAVLVTAIALLAREGREVQAVLVGSGPEQARLERLAVELDVGGRVAFRGALAGAEVNRCYAEASLFCSSSFAEGVPVVLMEAMACGLPVIATAIAGVGELVRDRETGLLLAPGRAEQLSRAIALLLDDPELAGALALAGRAHVRRDYDIDRSAASLAELFGEVLRPGEDPPRASAPTAEAAPDREPQAAGAR